MSKWDYRTCSCDHCRDTRNMDVQHHARILSANLAIGAALCRAFVLGANKGRAFLNEYARWDLWRPGCGRNAP